MDNRIFNVNGRTLEQLTLAVKLLLLDEYGDKQIVRGWYYSEEKGLVLTSFVDAKYKAKPFTDKMGSSCEIEEAALVEVLWNWLKTDDAKKVKCVDLDADIDQDGHNILGWRLYLERWGHVNNDGGMADHHTVAAFKPAWLWYGK